MSAVGRPAEISWRLRSRKLRRAVRAAELLQPVEVDSRLSRAASCSRRAVLHRRHVQFRYQQAPRPVPSIRSTCSTWKRRPAGAPWLSDTQQYVPQPDLEHRRERVLCDRLARVQGGREPGVGLFHDRLRKPRRHVGADVSQRQAQHRRRAQHAAQSTARSERRSRACSRRTSGPRPAHADRRRALRLLQRVGAARSRRRPDASCRRATTPRRRTACRAGTTGRSASARRLRPVRQRQDGGESLGRQVPGVAGAGARRARQPAAAQTETRIWTRSATATARRSTPTATRSTAEIGPPAQRQLRPAGRVRRGSTRTAALQQLGRERLDRSRS